MLFLIAAIAVVAITFTVLSTIGGQDVPAGGRDGADGKDAKNEQERSMSRSKSVSKKAPTTQMAPIPVAQQPNTRGKGTLQSRAPLGVMKKRNSDIDDSRISKRR